MNNGIINTTSRSSHDKFGCGVNFWRWKYSIIHPQWCTLHEITQSQKPLCRVLLPKKCSQNKRSLPNTKWSNPYCLQRPQIVSRIIIQSRTRRITSQRPTQSLHSDNTQKLEYPQTPTPMMTDNQASNLIENDIGKQRRSWAINMRFYWIKDRVKMGQFKIFWRLGEENYGDHCTKHHPPAHHREMIPRALRSKKVSFANQSQGHTWGCVDTSRTSVCCTYAKTLIDHSRT